MQRRYRVKEEYDGYTSPKNHTIKKGEIYDGNQLFRYQVPLKYCDEIFIEDKPKSSLYGCFSNFR